MKDKEYEEFVNQLANEFKQSIPENEESLTNDFIKYLYSAIKSLQQRGETKAEIKRKISLFSRYIINQDLDEKKHEIVVDDAFEQIRQISNQLFEIARKVLNSEYVNIEDDVSKKVSEMRGLLSSVKEYNRRQAENFISEAIVDFNYINNPQSGIMSIRIAHEIKRKEAEESIQKNMEGEER